ncbi:MAG: ATP synthase F1 subunit gamma [Candidatus Dormibacteria bacterium]
MASLRDLRRRIKSVTSTEKITKAMELVAAAKVRRAQERVLRARPYSEHLEQVIVDMLRRSRNLKHPYVTEPAGPRKLVILVTTDRGLCGALNSNTMRIVLQDMREHPELPWPVVAIGKKGRDMMHRLDRNVVAEVTGLGDRPHVRDILPAVHAAMEELEEGRVDEIDIAYAQFVSLGRQVATMKRLLPVVMPENIEPLPSDFDYEPELETLLGEILPRYAEAMAYQAVLENAASEQAAKMLAMRNASENAKDLITSLTLTANKVRQANITRELMDIVGGASALEQ